MSWRTATTYILAIALLAGALSPFVYVRADEVEDLQNELKIRRANIETINRQLDEYRKRINDLSKQTDSLENDVALLENEIGMAELDLAATRAEIDTAQLEIDSLQLEIKRQDEALTRSKKALADLLFAIQSEETLKRGFVTLLSSDSLIDALRSTAKLEAVNNEVQKVVLSTQAARAGLDERRARREETVEELASLESTLQVKADALEARRAAKEVLLAQTRSSESTYRSLVSDLRGEQQAVTSRINSLQSEVERRLRERRKTQPSSIPESDGFQWPLRGVITTLYHDPTYPFRHLFEHSGLDIAVPQGTPIEAAESGVVAWARTGTQYGNYVMIIHEGGYATLYAHMSRMDVKTDDVVSKGEVIGLSGGRRGSPGAGLSTGPHLHFEIRKGGIPVDPKPLLP